MNHDFDDHGYLGNQIHESRKQVVAEYKTFFQLAEDLNDFFQKQKYSFDSTISKEQRQEIIGSLFLRIINSYQAVIILLSYGGLWPDAAVVLRSLMEAVFNLLAMINDENFYKKYIENHNFEVRRFYKNNPNFVKQHNLVNYQEILNSKKIERIALNKIAEKAELADYYIKQYWSLSLDVHVGLKSIESFYNKKEELLELFHYDPEFIKPMFFLSFDLMLKTFEKISGFYQKKLPGDFIILKNRWKNLASEHPIAQS